MQKIKTKTAIVTLIAFILMMTIASSCFINVSFAMEDRNGNRLTYPVPAWQETGPSPWLFAGHSLTWNHSLTGYNDYSTVPQTPHILWQAKLGLGGVAGGFQPMEGFYQGYEISYGWGKLLVVGGRVYTLQMQYPEVTTVVRCLDEETGEFIWQSEPIEGEARHMQVLQEANMPGGNPGTICIALVMGKTVKFLDADNGALTFSYDFPRTVTWITLGWNDTVGVRRTGGIGSANNIYFYGGDSVNARQGNLYCYRITSYGLGILATPTLVWEAKTGEGASPSAMDENVIVVWKTTSQILRGFDRFTGKILYEVPFTSYQTGSIGYGKYYAAGEDHYLYAFDVNTGAKVWKSDYSLESFHLQFGITLGEGLCVTSGWNGYVKAFDAETGKQKWEYYVGDCPFEPYKSWYGTWPCNQLLTGGIGAFVQQTGDHMQHQPLPAGERMYVYESQTGTLRWSYPSSAGGGHDSHSPAVADGMIFNHDVYTGSLFAYGKGPSAVTVSVSQAQMAKGEYTWITGTVTDASAGQPGTPCVSKADMGTWMEYLHSGMPMPGPKTGVPLTLYAKSSDGTTITIGDVTTDGETGAFATQWVPPAEGLYTITAVFLGDESYWTSFGSTTLAVGAQQAAASASNSSATTAAISIASIAAVVIGTIAIKKPFKRTKEETLQ